MFFLSDCGFSCFQISQNGLRTVSRCIGVVLHACMVLYCMLHGFLVAWFPSLWHISFPLAWFLNSLWHVSFPIWRVSFPLACFLNSYGMFPSLWHVSLIPYGVFP